MWVGAEILFNPQHPSPNALHPSFFVTHRFKPTSRAPAMLCLTLSVLVNGGIRQPPNHLTLFFVELGPGAEATLATLRTSVMRLRIHQNLLQTNFSVYVMRPDRVTYSWTLLAIGYSIALR